jgi:hypothetical protein
VTVAPTKQPKEPGQIIQSGHRSGEVGEIGAVVRRSVRHATSSAVVVATEDTCPSI